MLDGAEGTVKGWWCTLHLLTHLENPSFIRASNYLILLRMSERVNSYTATTAEVGALRLRVDAGFQNKRRIEMSQIA